jgi:hypothetical protein
MKTNLLARWSKSIRLMAGIFALTTLLWADYQASAALAVRLYQQPTPAAQVQDWQAQAWVPTVSFCDIIASTSR